MRARRSDKVFPLREATAAGRRPQVGVSPMRVSGSPTERERDYPSDWIQSASTSTRQEAAPLGIPRSYPRSPEECRTAATLHLLPRKKSALGHLHLPTRLPRPRLRPPPCAAPGRSAPPLYRLFFMPSFSPSAGLRSLPAKLPQDGSSSGTGFPGWRRTAATDPARWGEMSHRMSDPRVLDVCYPSHVAVADAPEPGWARLVAARTSWLESARLSPKSTGVLILARSRPILTPSYTYQPTSKRSERGRGRPRPLPRSGSYRECA